MDSKASVNRANMPVGRIGKLSISRVISGSNLISPNMHARDLLYMNALASQYNTEKKVLETLQKCEENGVNAIVLKNHNFQRMRLARFWDELGGTMKWLADVITTDIDAYEKLLVEHLELGASAAYLWGGASDIWYNEKKPDKIVRAFEIMRKYDIPVGIGAHRLEPVMFCEKEGLTPDFYFTTLHHDLYWSAHPKANRRFLEMFEAEAPKYPGYHDNMFCHDPGRTIAFMQTVKVPWIAFKVMAAGAIRPQEAFNFAFAGGADFICIGMFDWQVEQDVELARQAIAKAKDRKRPWSA